MQSKWSRTCSSGAAVKCLESDAVDLDDGDSSADHLVRDDSERVEDRVDSLVGGVADAAEQQHAGAGAPESARIVPSRYPS